MVLLGLTYTPLKVIGAGKTNVLQVMGWQQGV